jgi:hypothetical protein
MSFWCGELKIKQIHTDNDFHCQNQRTNQLIDEIKYPKKSPATEPEVTTSLIPCALTGPDPESAQWISYTQDYLFKI